MKDYRVEITIRNNRIIEYMRQLGFNSVSALCREHGMSQPTVGQLINFRTPAIMKAGGWKPTALRLAEALCCEPDDLWTNAQRTAAIKRNRMAVTVAERDLIGLTEPPNPLRLIEHKETKGRIDRVLKTIAPRDEDVLRLRYGFKPYYRNHTFKEIADKYGVTVERIRQIKIRAIGRLRQPVRKGFIS